MKLSRWSIIPTALAAVLAMGSLAVSQTVTIAPNSPDVPLNGTSGGPKKDKSCAGFISNTPNHVIQVTADANLRFSLTGSRESTLLITGSQGQRICVQADSMSESKIEVPGRWTQGRYEIFVGERTQGRNPYTLSIAPQKLP
jgi:hypothetical protein